MKTILLITVLIMGFGFSSLFADQPLTYNWYVSCAYEGTEPITLLVVPNGSGSAFTQARDGSGAVVDATITLQCTDEFGDPVPNYPAEDLWLATYYGALSPCAGGGGATADQDTDEEGFTYWINPLRAGGISQSVCAVIARGTVVNEDDLPIYFNSPDITGDGMVNLADVGLFTHDIGGTYNFRSDFFYDGVINLSDVGCMAAGAGTSCP